MISAAFIARLREKVVLDEVIGDYVSLRRSGADALVGLCPFHDENTPSFNVRPTLGYFHCFGCGEGGDVFKFLQKLEQLSYVEAIERLANRYNLIIEYETDPHRSTKFPVNRGEKNRLILANKLANEYYQTQLASPDALPAREFLYNRGFDDALISRFDCGFAPRGWNNLTEHLISQGFAIKELEAAGLSRQTSRGSWNDRFRQRLLWPIHSMAGEVIGFGARKIFADDDMSKYVNTPETILYKKSQILFGLDKAKRSIAQKHQIVIVEGYTDVMAMHAAGIDTAVATCGTAFGESHAKLIRRVLLDDKDWQSEIIYTFDGDQAGQDAAIKAFSLDHLIIGQSFVAVAKDGLDPCDLRLKSGDESLKELISQRVPLLEFILKKRLDAIEELDTVLSSSPERRRQAIEIGAEVLKTVADHIVQREYAKLYANWIGLPSSKDIIQRIKELTARDTKTNLQTKNIEKKDSDHKKETDQLASSAQNVYWQDLQKKWKFDPVLLIQKQVFQAVLQYPEIAAREFDALSHEWFADPLMLLLKKHISGTDGVEAALGKLQGNKRQWLSTVLNDNTQTDKSEGSIQLIHEILQILSVEQLSVDEVRIPKYIADIFIRCHEQWVGTQISSIKVRLNRLRPETEEYMSVWHDLAALEAYRRTLIEQIVAT